MKESIKVRRSYKSYLLYGLWIIFTLGQFLSSQSSVKYIWGLLFLMGILFAAGIITKRYYMTTEDNKLIIHADFFQTRSVEIREIDEIIIKYGMFSESIILLKNKKGKVRFNNNNLRRKDFKKLLSKMNIQLRYA